MADAVRLGSNHLEHYGVHLLLDLVVAQIGTALGCLDHQIQKRKPALLACMH